MQPLQEQLANVSEGLKMGIICDPENYLTMTLPSNSEYIYITSRLTTRMSI